ncbi:MAG: hypothetical protein JST14_06800 [Bacteroidetes bacterium]|nr:hypothetical protein [Bacteroidota bacterium]
MKKSGVLWGALLFFMAMVYHVNVQAQKHMGLDQKDFRGRGHSREQMSKERGFASHVYRVTDADSLQRVKMKPAVDKASARLEALRERFRKQEKQVLDSLGMKIKPVLKEEQWQEWNDFVYHRTRSRGMK